MRQHTSREAINLCRKISDSLLTREQKAQFDNYIKLYNAVRNDEIYEDFYQIEEMKITEFSMDIINKFFELLKCNLDDALAKIKEMKQGEWKFSEKILDFKEDEKALVTILEETDLFNKLPGINLKNILSIMREHESQLVIAYPKNQLDQTNVIG